ncbi:hypothetical protein AVL63_02650 [Nesterenkonia jeotgali]|uniref:GAF domain-containing protein n=1 Tax=Nesterenkonia jeotgali TaxID=317018 RepID=A0A0W8IG40_9MICC|nr:hypothetical protein AVL63_02650 [Nesterenkonia jeotgali]
MVGLLFGLVAIIFLFVDSERLPEGLELPDWFYWSVVGALALAYVLNWWRGLVKVRLEEIAGFDAAAKRDKERQEVQAAHQQDKLNSITKTLDEMNTLVVEMRSYDGAAVWSPRESKQFQRMVVGMAQRVLADNVQDLRVCHYTAKFGEAGENERKHAVDAESSPPPRPNALTLSSHAPETRHSNPTLEFQSTDDEARGLFEPFVQGQVSHERNRQGFIAGEDSWRSAIRVPIKHERQMWGVLTTDCYEAGGVPVGCEQILSAAATLIALAKHYEEMSPPAVQNMPRFGFQ